MVLSDEKISHLSHLILNHLKAPEHGRLKVEEPIALREIKRLLTGELKAEQEADVAVRRRLASYSKPMAEGTVEWETMYRKAFQEEMRKRNKG